MVKKASTDGGINARLAVVCKTGKVLLGSKEAAKALRNGKSLMVIIASNVTPLKRSELEYAAMLAHVPVHLYPGTNADLGTALGRYFRVGVCTITDQGTSDILAATGVVAAQ